MSCMFTPNYLSGCKITEYFVDNRIIVIYRMRKYHLRNLHFGSVGIGSERNIRTRRGGIARRHTSAVVELTAEK